MIELFARNLAHNNLGIRILSAYLMFFVLLALSFTIGFFLLPEGIMKELPFLSLLTFNEGVSFVELVMQTLMYNALMLLLIIGANHIRVRSISLGYLPLFANIFLLGLFAGTNSFGGNISPYTLEGWLLFFQIGFLEFSAYILTCTATIGLALYHAEQWYYGRNWQGEKYTKIREVRDISLTNYEIIALIIAVGLLIIAAFNEWLYIS